MKVFAMIPARSGSKGLPHKNIKLAGGVPLIGHAVSFAKKLGVDRVVVATDSEEYIRVAAPFYDGLFWHHESGHAASDTSMEEVLIGDYVDQCHEVPDIWVWLKPTSPFRRIADVKCGIAELANNPYVDSVRLVSEADARLQYVDELGWLSWMGLCAYFGRSKMRRTDVKQVYKPFNLEIFRHAWWQQCPKLFMGTRIRPIVCPKITGIDIDGQDDLDLVDLIMSANPRPEWLDPYVHV